MRSLRGLDFFCLASKDENEGFKGVMGLVGVEGSLTPKKQQRKDQRARIDDFFLRDHACIKRG